jgi:allantoinase
VVDPARLHHRNPVSPYAGARLTGVVRSTWLAGTLVGTSGAGGRLLARGEA